VRDRADDASTEVPFAAEMPSISCSKLPRRISGNDLERSRTNQLIDHVWQAIATDR